MDVTGLMRQSAQFNARRIAVVHAGRRLTFAAAWDRGVRMANGLLGLGLQPGDRVSITPTKIAGARHTLAA